MLTVKTSYSPEDIADFQSLKGKGGHFARGLFIAESPKVVDQILRSRLRISSALLTEEYFAQLGDRLRSREEPITAYVAPKVELERIVGYTLHQGLMLAVEVPAALDLFASPLPDPWLAVALDSIADAENMGAIIRNCAAFGVTSIILDERSCNPFLRRSVRVSMGTVADVTFFRVPHLAPALEQLRDSGVTVVGAALAENAAPLSTARKHPRTVLVFGSEGWGIRESVRRACTELREIPMSNDVDSLNVAIANAIFLYEYTK